jgi:hypothetical protein
MFKTSASSNQPDARWLAEFTDELDVMIAQRELENAVAGVEKGRGLSFVLWIYAGDTVVSTLGSDSFIVVLI